MKKYAKFFILFVILVIIFVVINKTGIETSKEHNSKEDNLHNNQNEQSNKNIEGENNMNEFISKINININGTNYTATLEENNTTKEFLKMLPIEINMKELNGNEKYYYFDKSLPSNSSKIDKINSGDLMLYGNDCLVLFYESFNTSYSYTRIGKIDNPTSLKDNVGKGSIKISFTN